MTSGFRHVTPCVAHVDHFCVRPKLDSLLGIQLQIDILLAI